MTKKEWNRFRLQIVLGKKPDEDFILNEIWPMHCDQCKNYKCDNYNRIEDKKHKNMQNCKYKDCDIRWIDTIRKEGIVISHTYLTGFYPKEFSDD